MRHLLAEVSTEVDALRLAAASRAGHPWAAVGDEASSKRSALAWASRTRGGGGHSRSPSSGSLSDETDDERGARGCGWGALEHKRRVARLCESYTGSYRSYPYP